MLTRILLSITGALALAGAPAHAATDAPATPAAAARALAPIKIVTSLTTYGAIAREIVGDKATVTSIAQGDEDPHFVQPKPSFVGLLRTADLFVTTGLDLELWVPPLIDRAGNRKVSEGGPGYVTAYTGIQLLEVPTSLSRSEGDIHQDGNPHIHTDPINGIIIARNILTGLKRVDAGNAAFYTQREQDFERRILEALVGKELVAALTPATTFSLLRTNKFFDFIQTQKLGGQPLSAKLGGWLKQGEVFRGKPMACYHKEWAYFNNRFRTTCVEYIEAKPGIPPTPGHVQDVIRIMREQHIPVLFASNYFDRNQIRLVATRTGATPVIVAEATDGAPGTHTYFDLVDSWMTSLAAGFRGATATH